LIYLQSGSCKKKVDTEIFKNYKIRIPPIEIQKQTLEKIEPKESLIQELEKNIERAELEAKDIMSVLFN
jgi:restriction endonuclease S subunit